MAAGLRSTTPATAISAGSYGTTATATSSWSATAGDLLIAVVFNSYSIDIPTLDSSWTVQSTEGGQPTAILATKTAPSTGPVTVVASSANATMLHVFVWAAYGYNSFDDIQWSFDADNNPASQTRATSLSMIAPSVASSSASSAAPDLPFSLFCTWYDGVTVPTITNPTGYSYTATAQNTTYGTVARSYQYPTVATNGAQPARTAKSSRVIYSTNLSFILRQSTPATLLGTLTDTFATDISGTTWPDQAWTSYNGTYHCAQVQASYSGTTVNYGHLRSALAYTFVGSQLVCQIPHFPDASGDTANAQIWIQPDQTPGVNRIGFEYVAASNTLVFRGQTTGYAPIGTDVSIPYNALSRWLRISYDTTNGIRWYTSPDGVNWTLQRTLAAASVPAWCAGTNTLQASFEAYRSTGVNDNLMITNVNSPPGSPVLPTWIISTAPTGKTTWVADLTKADAVTAGYQDMNWNIQPSGIVTWPPLVVPAPYGRTGGAVQVRLPDTGKRNELQPDGIDYQDGDSIWEGFAFCVGPETDLQATAGGAYQVIWQLRPENDVGSPPVAIEVRNGQLLLTGGWDRPDPTGADVSNNATYSYTQTLLSSVQTATWYRIVIFVGLWSAYNSGRVDVWVNDVSVLSNYVPPPGTNYPPHPIDADHTTLVPGSYLKCGIYHDPANRGMTNYIADHKLGTSYLAVAPPAAPQAFGQLELASSR